MSLLTFYDERIQIPFNKLSHERKIECVKKIEWLDSNEKEMLIKELEDEKINGN